MSTAVAPTAGSNSSSKPVVSKQTSLRNKGKQGPNSKTTIVVEPPEVTERSRSKEPSNSIQFVHYSGDTHFEPQKLADVKLQPMVDGATGDRQHESVVRLDLLDIKSDDVYEKLQALGPRLHSLAIRDLSLTYIPKELQPVWQNIRSLDLSGNSLNEFSISDTLPHLTALSEFNLNKNNIQQLPKNFKGLKQLKRLHLSQNRLIGVSNLDATHLQWFVADSNNLVSIDSFLMSSNCDRTLQVLDVSHNELTALPSAIRHFRCLVDLDISSNNIRLLPIELFKLQSLQFLNASSNRISHVPSFSTQTASFSRSQLHAVDLSENVLSKLPEHLLFLADRVDVSGNSIKFIRGNLLQKIAFSSKKQLRIDENPLLFPPASLVAADGLRGLLNFFSAIKNKVKRRQGIKVFVVGAPHNGKTSFVKSLVDEFPHIADESTIMANYDEFFVDIDAPGELGQLLSTGSSSTADNSNNNNNNNSTTSVSQTPGPVETMASDLFLSRQGSSSSSTQQSHGGHNPDGSCCESSKKESEEEDDEAVNVKKEKDEDLQEVGPDFGNARTIGLPREFAAVRKRVKRSRNSVADIEKDLMAAPALKQNDPASLWKCVQLPVLDISGRGIFAALRKFFLEDSSIYLIVFNLSSFPTTAPVTSPITKQWYRDNIGRYLDEIFALCTEAYVVLVGSFFDKINETTTEIEIRCNAVLSLTASHLQIRTENLASQLQAIEQKGQITMADQERLMLLRNLLEKQKVRIGERVLTFSSQVEGNFSSTTLSFLIELLQSGAALGDLQDPFFKPALEPITNLHSDIIEYIELLASSMRFPIVDNGTFEDIFFKEYQIISEQIVKRIPKFLHQTGHIFWSLKNDILSDLVVLRPEFVNEFLIALFAFIFDEKALQAAVIGMQEAGRRLHQLGANEVREAAMRFVRTGLLNTVIGELFVRKGLNIKSSEALQSNLAGSSPSHRHHHQRYSSVSESEAGDADEGYGKAKEGISSAPIHVCVEKFCVGFQMAYVFETDSLEYTTLFHPKISEIDMKHPRITEPPPVQKQSGITTTSTTSKIDTKADKAPETPKEKKAVSFAPPPLVKKGSKSNLSANNPNDSSEASSVSNNTSTNAVMPSTERLNSPTKRLQSPVKQQSLSSSSSSQHQSSSDDNKFFLKFSKNAKVVRQAIVSTSSSAHAPSMGVGGRSESKSPSTLAMAGRAPSNVSSSPASNHRFLLFPALRPPTLPDAYRLAIADAWDSLSPDMWIGASLSFPTNFYPPSAFHEIVCRVRRKVEYLEFGYVWQKGAFGKFINSANCFVKFLHHTAAPIDCDLNSMFADSASNTPTAGPDCENTITFELRTNSDIPSPESAKLNMVVGFLFSEKTLRDYVMNLWERLYEILAVVEEYCNGFAALLVERRVRCPFCRKLSFIGEWTSPRELQAFHEKPCPSCEKVVDTAYLVQPKSCQRELCERIMKDIQKRRATSLLASAVIAENSGDSDSSDDADNAFIIREEEDGGDDTESSPQSRNQSRRSRRSAAESAVSAASSKSKKSARLMANHSQLLSMMTSNGI